jgi:GNAT superfamily N-acetyltransferase
LSPPASSTTSAVAEDAVDVILRHGTILRLRPPTAADADALLAFFAGLSDGSRCLRFNGVRRVDKKLVEPVVDPDWHERGALVGTLADDGEEHIVALGNYIRDPALAESAFVVADELQGRGIGTRLLEQLAARAAAAG